MIINEAVVKGYTVRVNADVITGLFEVKVGRNTYWACDSKEEAEKSFKEIIEKLAA